MAISEEKKTGTSLWLVPIIALGFASTQLSWSLFNIAIPLFLDDTYNLSLTVIGFVMTWDNIIAFFLQPYIGSLSDKTRTRFGRRMPFIIPGILLGATFFYLIPYARNYPLYVFLLSIVIFNLAMAYYRSPAVSLMPDLIDEKRRSIGNGIVNFMGGVAAGLTLFTAGKLLKSGLVYEAFGFVSLGMLVCLVILVAFIREPKDYTIETEEKPNIFQELKQEAITMYRSEDRSMFYMLLAILSWFMAWNAIEAFYSTYVWRTFLPELTSEEAGGVAGGVLFIFPVVFVVFTIIGGTLGQKLGRFPTMKIGLTFMTLSIAAAALVQEESFLGITIPWETSFTIIFVIAGASWGLINVNSIVVIWHHAKDNGTGTGLYYAFSSAAAILGPTLVGPLMDIRLEALFIFSIFFLVLAMIFLLKVKTGEITDEEDLVGEAIGEMND